MRTETQDDLLLNSNLIPSATLLNQLALEVHEANAKWWTDLETGEPKKRNIGEMLMLMVSELAEAMEGDRKNLMDDKLPHRKMLEVELADALIRGLDLAGHRVKNISHFRLMTVGVSIQFSTNAAENLFSLTRNLTRLWPDANDAMVWSIWFHNVFAFANTHKLDLWGAYMEKMEYNKTRADHQREARLAEGGKKY